jgi:hypothetical protein
MVRPDPPALPVRCGHGATSCARYVLRCARRVLYLCDVAIALRVVRDMYCDAPVACSARAMWPWRYEMCEVCTAIQPARALPVRCGHGATRYVLRCARRVLYLCGVAMALRVARGMYCDTAVACSASAVWPWRYELREVCTAMRPSRALPVRCGHGATRCARYVLRCARRVLYLCDAAMMLRRCARYVLRCARRGSARAMRPWRYEVREVCTAMRPARALPVRCGHGATRCARGMYCDTAVARSASAMRPWRYELCARCVVRCARRGSASAVRP